MSIGTIRRAATLAVLPLLLAGCDLLALAYPDLGPLGPLGPDPWPEPGVGVVYEHGTATVEIEQGDAVETVVLDELVEGSESSAFGATVTWRNDDGWAMTITSYSDPAFPAGSSSEVMLQRISGTELWVTDYMDTYSRCVVQMSGAMGESMSGSVECDGLRWTEGLGGSGLYGTPRYVDGEQSFHLHVDFEAAADDSIQS